ncbi:Prolyl oligopeptidase family protein [compost metagenome]
MKAIKKLLLAQVLLLLLCGYYSAAQVLSGGSPDSYSLAVSGMSPDGRWITASLLHGDSVDSTIVIDTKHSRTKAYSDVKRSIFVGHSLVLLTSGGTATIFDHEGSKTLELRNVTAVEDIGDSGYFLLQRGIPGRAVVTLLDLDGKILDSVADTERYFINRESGEVLVTAVEEHGTSKVYAMGDKGKKLLYTTIHKITNIQHDAGSSSIILFEKQGNGISVVTLLDRGQQKRYVLTDLLDEKFSSISIQPLAGKGAYFVRTEVPAKRDDRLVDIWLEDSALESKLIPYPVEHAYLWQPAKSELKKLSTSALPKVECIGSDRFFLAFDPQKLQDYTSGSPNLEVFLLDLVSGESMSLGIFGPNIAISPKGNHMLGREEGRWVLIDLKRKSRVKIAGEQYSSGLFSLDGRHLLFEGMGGIWRYDIRHGRTSKVVESRGRACSVANKSSDNRASRHFSQKSVDLDGPLLIRLFDPMLTETGYLRWERGKVSTVLPLREHHITGLLNNTESTVLSFVREDYNLVPELVVQHPGKTGKTVYRVSDADTGSSQLRREIINYAGPLGEKLQGILYYPACYSSGRAYPMVVHIYEQQRFRKNRYLSLSNAEPDGFNPRALLEKGYFVYFPDIAYSDKGPGISALLCVGNAMKAIEDNRSVDFSKVGLIGHSFGGYEACFIATHSDLFAAYVCGAANSDLINRYHSFNTSFSAPEFWRFESGQFRMNTPFSENKALYLDNSPLYFADRVLSPVLLWTGMEDYNVRWEETRTFYNALRRNNKEVIALFYPGEGHTIAGRQAMLDLTLKIQDWFDCHLKDYPKVGWMGK